MYNPNVANHPGPQGQPPLNPQQSPFGNAFYGAGSEFIKTGLGAYGEKFLGSSSEFMQSNVCLVHNISLIPSFFEFLITKV
jgi:protein transport protein YIF1